MARALDFSRRLSPSQTAPSSVSTSPAIHTHPDVYPLRRAAEQAWETWRWCPEPVDSPIERRLRAQHQVAEALLQAVIADAQRALGIVRDPASCVDAKAELLRRIGYGGEVGES